MKYYYILFPKVFGRFLFCVFKNRGCVFLPNNHLTVFRNVFFTNVLEAQKPNDFISIKTFSDGITHKSFGFSYRSIKIISNSHYKLSLSRLFEDFKLLFSHCKIILVMVFYIFSIVVFF